MKSLNDMKDGQVEKGVSIGKPFSIDVPVPSVALPDAPLCPPERGPARERIFLSPPHMGGEELKFISQAFESNFIAPVGPMVDGFEREFAAYTGFGHCLALCSGTAAMHLALRELGVGAGDVVIGSSLTFIGSVSPATFLGARLSFIDAERGSWNMDPGLLEVELAACARDGAVAEGGDPDGSLRAVRGPGPDYGGVRGLRGAGGGGCGGVGGVEV